MCQKCIHLNVNVKKNEVGYLEVVDVYNSYLMIFYLQITEIGLFFSLLRL